MSAEVLLAQLDTQQLLQFSLLFIRVSYSTYLLTRTPLTNDPYSSQCTFKISHSFSRSSANVKSLKIDPFMYDSQQS